MITTPRPSSTVLAIMDTRPVELEASGAAWVFTAIVAAAFVVVAIWCCIYSIRNRDAIPLLMLGSGLLSVGLESVVDTMGKVWYATDNPWVVYTAIGVPQPAFLLLGYTLFWGGTVYIGSRFVQRGTDLWRIFAVVFAMDLFVEYVGASMLNVGVYYDFSPFTLFEFPLWWAFVNGAVACFGIWLLITLEDVLHGWRRLAILVVAPTAFGGTHAICAWPVWVTLHSDTPQWLGWLAGVYAIAMAFGVVALAKKLISDHNELIALRSRATADAPVRPATQTATP